MSNNRAIYEIISKQFLRSILDISAWLLIGGQESVTRLILRRIASNCDAIQLFLVRDVKDDERSFFIYRRIVVCCCLISRLLFVSRLQMRTALPLVFITLSWEDWRDWWCPLRCRVQSLIHLWNSALIGGSVVTCDSLVHGLLFLDCIRALVSKRKGYNKANRWDLISSR